MTTKPEQDRSDPVQQSAARPHLVTLILLSGLSVVTLNLLVASLANIADEFGASYGLVSLSIAGYSGISAVLLLFMGPLSDRFGRRPVILSGLAIFCVASLGCALASSVEVFLLFRMLQAVIVCGHGVSMAVIRDTSSEQRSASMIGYVAMAWAVAPMLGPLVGGTLDDLFGWRASFWLFLAAGLVLFALSWFDLAETNHQRSASLAQQFRSYGRLVGSRLFWAYALCMAFSVGAFYAYVGGAPLVATSVFGMQPAKVGFYIGTITAGFMAGSFVSGRLAENLNPVLLILAGRIIGCCSLAAGLLLLASGIISEITFFGSCVIAGFGNGLTTPSCNAGAMSVEPRLAGSASGLTGAFIVAVGAVLSGITGTVLTPETAAQGLVGIMLATYVVSLVAAIAIAVLRRQAISQ
jgi:Bcr/CflA subfamily drug resistance transporter